MLCREEKTSMFIRFHRVSQMTAPFDTVVIQRSRDNTMPYTHVRRQYQRRGRIFGQPDESIIQLPRPVEVVLSNLGNPGALWRI
jgi:hypothetical protein